MADDADAWKSDFLRARADQTPDRLALVDAATGRESTYRQFDRNADRVVAALADAGVAAGATVATLLDSRPMAVVLPFATIRAGATLAPLNVDLDPETLAEMVDRLDPDLLLCEEGTEATATDVFDGPVATVDVASHAGVQSFDLGAFDPTDVPAAIAEDERAPLAPDQTALIVFTSGTTGRPKGVRLTTGNLTASAVASAERLGVAPHDRWLSPLSTYHVGGLAPYLRSTLYGTAAILQREFDAEATAVVLDERPVTCASFVPTMLSRVLDAGWRPDSSFRFVLLGGGPATDSLLERCLARDVPVCPTYGATETASQVATATPGETVAAPGTVGRPLRGAEVRTVDAEAEESETAVPDGEVGELVVSGPMVSPGYLDPAATTDSFSDGVFRTGDLARRDDSGRLRIVGRADDVVVTGGENVRPEAVAAGLREHGSVADAAVVGVPDAEWGERVVALVVAQESVDGDDLRTFVRGRVADFAVPKSIAFADELPRTPSGTVDRAAVRERFE